MSMQPITTDLSEIPNRLRGRFNWRRIAVHALLFPGLLVVVLACAVLRLEPVYTAGQIVYDTGLLQVLPPLLEDLGVAALLAATGQVALTAGYRYGTGGED